ncbi:hypothetical protein OYC64_017452 [Pagothenia borchgrevinki]|uniref:Uncharacterized protein n=1 Tax=Pagothenia borchgrevinki TaxID=8213 RepID=A0ABD2GKF3_PAGBO
MVDHRTCPNCPNLISGVDPHPLCFTCLGPDHAMNGMGSTPACSACQAIPRRTREHRGQHFLEKIAPQEESEELDLDVVDMGDSGSEGTSFRFSLPWGQTAPVPEVQLSALRGWISQR